VHFSKERLDKLSDITISIGQVFFASAIIEPIFSGNFHWYSIFMGIILSTGAWFLSVFLLR
jgi:hypothetical protein